MTSRKVEIEKKELLSDNWYILNKYTIRLQQKDGSWQNQTREVYDRGNGATILLFNRTKKTVILTRQFRLPTYLNGNADGMLIEACAGLLDEDSPDQAIRRETEEETGYSIKNPQKVFELYMSPGSVTEILHFYIGEYSENEKTAKGGGIEGEEDIDVLELSYEEALGLVAKGEIKDAKTVLLLQHLRIQGLL